VCAFDGRVVTGQEESAYRLRVATTLGKKAEAAFARGEWREAALFARAAILFSICTPCPWRSLRRSRFVPRS